MIKICASILASDYSKLGEEIKRAEQSGVDYIHVDIMDGHFVSDITFGAGMVKVLKPLTKLKFNSHLMIENPEFFINDFIQAGSDIITIHPESCPHLYRAVQTIKSNGKRPAIGINSTTSLKVLDWIISEVDMVLLICVNMGMGGQNYIPFMTEKIKQLKDIVQSKNLKVDIAVDGAIGLKNIYEVTKAGANIIIAGTTLFKSENMNETVRKLRESAYSE
jgi:ribulose-phosphate 3-epimerase